MTPETYEDMLAFADRAEAHCGPSLARGIRERTELLSRGHDAPAARAQLIERARLDVNRVALRAEAARVVGARPLEPHEREEDEAPTIHYYRGDYP